MDASTGNDNDDELTVSPIRRTPPAIPRRVALRRLTLIAGGVAAVAAAEACGCVLLGLYPKPTNAFGGPMMVGGKTDFPAALPRACQLDRAGVFYRREAQAFIVHLIADTTFQLSGSTLADALSAQDVLQDRDGSYWMALYQICVHDTSTVRFLPCTEFRCPSCGASYAVDGEYLDGPAPRSLDRFPVSFNGHNVVLDTGRLNMSVARPSIETRLLPLLGGPCPWPAE